VDPGEEEYEEQLHKILLSSCAIPDEVGQYWEEWICIG